MPLSLNKSMVVRARVGWTLMNMSVLGEEPFRVPSLFDENRALIDKESLAVEIRKFSRSQRLKQTAPVSCLYTHHVDHVAEREARQDPVAAQAVGHAAGE
jgi:hypothetical protein